MGQRSVSYFGLLGLESESFSHSFVREGRKSVSYFGLFGPWDRKFFPFPHSFEWLPQKPHLSSTPMSAKLYSLCHLSLTSFVLLQTLAVLCQAHTKLTGMVLKGTNMLWKEESEEWAPTTDDIAALQETTEASKKARWTETGCCYNAEIQLWFSERR